MLEEIDAKVEDHYTVGGLRNMAMPQQHIIPSFFSQEPLNPLNCTYDMCYRLCMELQLQCLKCQAEALVQGKHAPFKLAA